jgi:hypothetical protein
MDTKYILYTPQTNGSGVQKIFDRSIRHLIYLYVAYRYMYNEVGSDERSSESDSKDTCTSAISRMVHPGPAMVHQSL